MPGALEPDVVCGNLRSGISPSWMPRALAANSEPIRELVTREPRTEKASSSSAAAFTLALSSGRRDSFSSRANVVPEVMLFPSMLGGLVPSSELESALCESSDPLSLLWTITGLSVDKPLPLTTRLGAFGPRLIRFKDSATLSAALCWSSDAKGARGCEETTWWGGGPADPPLAITGLVDVGGDFRLMGCSLEGVAMWRTEGEGAVSLETDAATWRGSKVSMVPMN
jgi:hypothetical protein